MPQPLPSDVHVNAPLTNISVAYEQDLERFFVAQSAFPAVPVSKQSDVYFTFPSENWHRDQAQVRPLSSESAGGGFPVTTDTYSADVYAIHKNIDDRLRANQDDPLDLDDAATRWVTQQMWIRREKQWAADHFVTGTWTGGTVADPTPTTKWNAASSTPITDIRKEMDSIHLKTGRRPNKLVLPQTVWSALQDNDDFIGRISIQRDQIVTRDLLARVLELDEILVGGAVEVTSEEQAATTVRQYIMDDAALLLYTPGAPSLMEPSAGYTFNWTGLLGTGAGGMRIKRFRMEPINSDRVEGESAWAQKQVAPDLGVFFQNVLA